MSGTNAGGNSYVDLTFSPPPSFQLTLDGLHATEELGRPFAFDLDLSSATQSANLQSLLGSGVTIKLTVPSGPTRYFNGIVAHVAYAGMDRGSYRYKMQLRPWIWLLSRTQDCKIFQNKTAFAIIKQVFSDAGFSDLQDKRQNQAGEITLEYCVQYRETSLDFVTRLMETFGIYYYFTHSDGKHTLVLADDPNSHTAVTPAIPFKLDETEMRSVEDHVWEFSTDLNLTPGALTLRDYNFTTPSADLTTKSLKPWTHTHGSLEVYEYPGPYDTVANGQKYADVRMQDLASRQQTFAGTTNGRGVVCGSKFTLSKAKSDDLNKEYLVTHATYTLDAAEARSDSSGELTDTFRCVFHAVRGDTQFRLERQTQRPVITGPQTAKVVGASGDEITTDQYGRIKVKFYWDRSDVQNENASCWVRVAQVSAGVGWGSMFIPRIGQEVIVEFLDGNPDRPIVTGSVYNASVTIPYAQPGNATRSGIKSNSSKGGGGFNELRFEDKKDSEEVFFQAQKDYNWQVLNNETAKITKDTTTTVDQGNRSVTLNQGNNALTVSAGNDSITVSQGDHSITVTAGKSSVTAGTSITLTVGGNSIKIDTGGITITTAKLEITSEGKIDATAGGPVSVQAGAKMGLQSGGPMQMEAGAPMSLTAPMININ